LASTNSDKRKAGAPAPGPARARASAPPPVSIMATLQKFDKENAKKPKTIAEPVPKGKKPPAPAKKGKVAATAKAKGKGKKGVGDEEEGIKFGRLRKSAHIGRNTHLLNLKHPAQLLMMISPYSRVSKR
jgi:hypothetical protein